MCYAIAECSRVDEVKDLADKAQALKAYARQRQNVTLYRQFAEIELRAKRQIGVLSKALDTTNLENLPDVPRSGRQSKREALAAAGLSKSEAHRCEVIADVDERVFAEYLAQKEAAGKAVVTDEVIRLAVKKEKKQKVVETIEQFDGCTIAEIDTLIAAGKRFGTIYADPPWIYDNQSTRAATGNHYNGLSVDELCELPIRAIAADDSHLHLWTTNAFLFDAPKIFDAWGFEFRSSFVWVKPQMGIGNYWRNSHEILLTAIRGNAKRFSDHSLMSWGRFDRAQHSAKPEQIRQMLERSSPGPYLELFGRRKVDGWTVWGNQIERNLFNAEAA
jgi:N6-adenosine-specific RNA methylase IME4